MHQTTFWKYIIGIFLIQQCFTAYFKVLGAENENSAEDDLNDNPSSGVSTDPSNSDNSKDDLNDNPSSGVSTDPSDSDNSEDDPIDNPSSDVSSDPLNPDNSEDEPIDNPSSDIFTDPFNSDHFAGYQFDNPSSDVFADPFNSDSLFNEKEHAEESSTTNDEETTEKDSERVSEEEDTSVPVKIENSNRTCAKRINKEKKNPSYATFESNYCTLFDHLLLNDYYIFCDLQTPKYWNKTKLFNLYYTICRISKNSSPTANNISDVKTNATCLCGPQNPSHHECKNEFKRNIIIGEKWGKEIREIFKCEKDFECQCQLSECYKGDLRNPSLDAARPNWCTLHMQKEMKLRCLYSERDENRKGNTVNCYLLEAVLDFTKDITCRKDEPSIADLSEFVGF